MNPLPPLVKYTPANGPSWCGPRWQSFVCPSELTREAINQFCRYMFVVARDETIAIRHFGNRKQGMGNWQRLINDVQAIRDIDSHLIDPFWVFVALQDTNP